MAREAVARNTPEQRAELWDSCWRGDLFNAMGNLDASGGGMMAPARREAERLVREHWEAIERVATALRVTRSTRCSLRGRPRGKMPLPTLDFSPSMSASL